MADGNLSVSFPLMKEDRYCRYSYVGWCPICDRESPRRRTKSETNELCRRKGKEMKTFTPKKYNRCREYENMDVHAYDKPHHKFDGYCQRPDDGCQRFDVSCHKWDGGACHIRQVRHGPFAEPNLFELPTTYIASNNCQIFNDMSNYKVSSAGTLERPSPRQHPEQPSPWDAEQYACASPNVPAAATMNGKRPEPTRPAKPHAPHGASIFLNAKRIANSPYIDAVKNGTERHDYHRPDTCTFFDRKDYDVAAIKERYHREVEALRLKLKEIQKTRLLAAQLKKQYHDKEIIEVTPEVAENAVEIVHPIRYEMKGARKTLQADGPSAGGPTPRRRTVRRAKADKTKTEKPKMVLKTRSKANSVKIRHAKTKIVKEELSEFSLSDSDEESVKKDENNMRIEEEVVDTKRPNGKLATNLGTSISSNVASPDRKTEHPDEAKWPLRESLFPNIPPYLSFNTYNAEQPFAVPSGKRVLKWKLSTITPILVRKTLINTGFVLIRKSNDWLGCWGKHMKSPQFKTLKDMHKLNHFPGTFQIGRKDRLWKNLQKLMFKYGYKDFDFMPQSFVIPQDLKLLKQCWENKNGSGNEIFIIKPPASARGAGIKVINKWSQLPKKQSLVVQRYISNPYLINGSKFDLRLYVLVTSFNPLRIYLYPEGLARFASAKYSGNVKDLKDRYMHLTNYSINKLSSQYTANEDAFACQGHKWTLSKLWEFMQKDGVDTKALWKKMEDLVIKTMICGESPITQLSNENMNNRYNCYELFGVDILLDERFKCWLLEVNISPSLHSASPLDAHVKGPMVKALFDIAQFHLPPKAQKRPENKPSFCFEPKLYTKALTKRETHKHNYFVQCERREEYLQDVLTTLTGDDVRHLTRAEDELTVRGSFVRVFPTSKTYHYLKFMEPRYYNRLFDAWENKYEHHRTRGISVLQKLCLNKLHLKVGCQSNMSKDLPNLIPALDCLPKTEERPTKQLCEDNQPPAIAAS